MKNRKNKEVIRYCSDIREIINNTSKSLELDSKWDWLTALWDEERFGPKDPKKLTERDEYGLQSQINDGRGS